MVNLELSLNLNYIVHVAYESRQEFSEAPNEFYYLSYGSNLSLERFRCYISGGTPQNSTRTYLGCRDTTPPKESIGVIFNGQVYFAGNSKVWGGGMMFADFEADSQSLGRMHLITKQQFQDVVSQENGLEAGGVEVDFNTLLSEGELRQDGTYGRAYYVGTHRGVPVISFTTNYSFNDVVSEEVSIALNMPSDAYRNTICSGLMESFDIDERQANKYLDSIPPYRSPL